VAKRRSAADIAAEMEVVRTDALALTEAEGTDEELEANITRSQELLSQWDELDAEYQAAVAYEKRIEAIRSKALDVRNTESGDGAAPPRYLGGTGPEVKKSVDPFDADPRALSKGEVISRAMMVIDREKRVPISDSNKEHLEYLIHRSEDEDETQFDGSYIARRTLLTESPLYRSAFRKYMRGGIVAFTAEEQRAVEAFQTYEIRRAASENTTTAGGFGIPVKLAA
jgi:hypothetical protein